MITLFNFATKRAPQMLRDTDRSDLFIEVDGQVREFSHYLSDVEPGDFRSFRSMFTGRAADFAEQLPASEIVRIAGARTQLFELSRKPVDNGYLEALLEAAVPPSMTARDRALLWDNLIDAIWIRRDQTVADAVVAVLVGDHLIAPLSEVTVGEEGPKQADIRRIRRLSQSRVVIPLPLTPPSLSVDNRPLPRDQVALLMRAHDRFVEHYEADQLLAAVAEFSGQWTIRRDAAAEADAAAREERQALLATAVEGLNLSPEDLQPALATITARTVPRFMAADIGAELTGRAQAYMAPFIASGSAASAVAEAKEGAQVRRSRAILTAATHRRATFRAFGVQMTVEERTPLGGVVVGGVENGNGALDVYLTYHHGGEVPRLGRVEAQVTANDATTATSARPLKLLHPAFQTFRLTPEPIEGPDFTLSLRLHPEDAAFGDGLELPSMQMASSYPRIFLVSFEEATALEPTGPTTHGLRQLGVVDFRRVEQELNCYVKSEVSHIENIMASEFKEKVARSYRLLESESEIYSELTTELTTDTETTQRHEMQSEVSEVLNKERGRSFNFSSGLEANFPGGGLNTNWGYNQNQTSSREEASSEAVQFAQTVTSKVQERILQKSTSRRRTLSRRESEITNKHGYDNRQGDDHVVGIYRWVDKVMENKLVNYGRRSVVEFELPEPARNFIQAQELAAAEAGEFTDKPPKTLEEIGLTDPALIQHGNYTMFAKEYGLELKAPPAQTVVVNTAYERGPDEIDPSADSTSASDPHTAIQSDLVIPDGYRAKSATIRHFSNWKGDNQRLLILIDDQHIEVATQILDPFTEEITFKPHVRGTLPIAIYAQGQPKWIVTISVTCGLVADLYHAWQYETYNLISEAYEAKLAEYEAALKAAESASEPDLNPRFKHQLMHTELRRLCIEMMTRPFGIDLARDHYIAGIQDTHFDQLDLTGDIANHMAHVRFFEEAFDWELVAYSFYPYYYAAKETWMVKLGMEATRASVFESFLKSGMARILVPIRRGFEDAVSFYLETGEVWFGGGFVLDLADGFYLSLAEETVDADEEAWVEKTWTTRLPTDLTILQERGAALVGEGLPCVIEEERLALGESRLDPVLPVPVEDDGGP